MKIPQRFFVIFLDDNGSFTAETGNGNHLFSTHGTFNHKIGNKIEQRSYHFISDSVTEATACGQQLRNIDAFIEERRMYRCSYFFGHFIADTGAHKTLLPGEYNF